MDDAQSAGLTAVRPSPVTPLGRACAGESGGPQQGTELKTARSGGKHSHTGRTDWLRDVILGGQDGLVNILGSILGAISGGGNRVVLISAGFAAAITESISMGAVGYTSTVADRDFYSAQLAIEESSVRDDPDLECEEITDLYRSKGFSGSLLDQVVATITANREKWVGAIMEEERHLQPVRREDVVRSSVVITTATLIGHLIPLVPFLFLARTPALVLAIVLSAMVLFGVGVYSAITRVGAWWKSGSKMVFIGLSAAGVGFVIGRLFHASGA
jgi:predicted membrane protein (TIGR00267 family)